VRGVQGDVEKAHPFHIDVEDRAIRAEAGGHARGVDAGGAAAEDHHFSGQDAGGRRRAGRLLPPVCFCRK